MKKKNKKSEDQIEALCLAGEIRAALRLSEKREYLDTESAINLLTRALMLLKKLGNQ